MNGKRSTILYLHQRAPDAALDALNRLTGLRFTQWPESLVDRLVDRSEGRSGQQAEAVQNVPDTSKQVSG